MCGARGQEERRLFGRPPSSAQSNGDAGTDLWATAQEPPASLCLCWTQGGDRAAALVQGQEE